VIGKIALEEHFALPETLADSTRYARGPSWSLLEQRLLDLHDHRVSQMDAHGIAYAILSLNSPAMPMMCSQTPSRGSRIDWADSRHSRCRTLTRRQRSSLAR
jgi:hypothetical protein